MIQVYACNTVIVAEIKTKLAWLSDFGHYICISHYWRNPRLAITDPLRFTEPQLNTTDVEKLR